MVWRIQPAAALDIADLTRFREIAAIGAGRFERPATASQTQCSTRLSYAPLARSLRRRLAGSARRNSSSSVTGSRPRARRPLTISGIAWTVCSRSPPASCSAMIWPCLRRQRLAHDRGHARPAPVARVDREQHADHALLGDGAGGRAVPGPHRRAEEARALPDRRLEQVLRAAHLRALLGEAELRHAAGATRSGCRSTMPASRSAPHDVRRLLGVAADHEERRAHVQRAQLGQHLPRVRARAVVERERHAALAVRAGRRARPSVPRSSKIGPSPRVAVGCGDGAARAAPRARAGLRACRARRRLAADRAAARCRAAAAARQERRTRRTMPPATSSAATTASSRRRAYTAHPAPTGVVRRGPPRRRALRGQLEAGVDHHEARELRAEHDAVGVAERASACRCSRRRARRRRPADWRRRARGAAASARCRRAARSCRAC